MPDKNMNLCGSVRWIGLLIAVLLQACTQVPRPDLYVYQTAFAKTAETGAALYQEAAQVLRDVQAAKAEAAQAGGKAAKAIGPPASFNPENVTASSDEILTLPEAIQVRVLALDTVLAYNDALVAHVSGDPLDRIRRPIADSVQRLDGFAGLVAGLTGESVDVTGVITGEIKNLAVSANPFGGLALAGLKKLIELGLQEKAAIEFQNALLAAHSDIDSILELLEKDTVSLYGFAKIRCALTRQTGIKHLRDDAVKPMRTVANAFQRPTGQNLAPVVALEQRIGEAVTGIFQPETAFDPCGTGTPTTYTVDDLINTYLGSYPFTFYFSENSAAKEMDATTIEVLELLVTNYERRSGEMVAAQDRLQSYHDQLLPDYVALIRSARDGLRTLKDATVEGNTFDSAGLMRLGEVIRANVASVKRTLDNN